MTTTHVTMYDIARLFGDAYVKVAIMEKGISGFKVAGIYPFNPNKFTEEDFVADEEFREIVV